MMALTLKLKLLIIFLCLFNEYYDISQDSFKVMVDKYVANISLSDYDIKHIEYPTRGQQSSHLWKEYRQEKLAASNFYIAAVNKVEASKRIKSLFYSSVKTSSMNYSIANENVALTEYVTLLTSQSVAINVVRLGLILSKSHAFLGASLDYIVTNLDNLETWGVKIKCPSSKLVQSINDVLKDKKFHLEKANGKIQLKRSHKYFYQI